jgi:hypothetical protein
VQLDKTPVILGHFLELSTLSTGLSTIFVDSIAGLELQLLEDLEV